MGRRRSVGSDYRICEFRGGTGNRISERRTGHGNRLQDIYHSRSGDIIWNLFKLGTWSGVLDMEDFESDVKMGRKPHFWLRAYGALLCVYKTKECDIGFYILMVMTDILS